MGKRDFARFGFKLRSGRISHIAQGPGYTRKHEGGLRRIAQLILGLRPANERRRYFVTTSLIGWRKPKISPA